MTVVSAWNCWVPQPANTTTVAHSTGRQRGDGRWPSGNSRTMQNIRSTVAKAPTGARHPTALAAGTAPGAVATPYSAYCSANMLVATDRPIEPSSQPMALSGRRLTIIRPLTAYSSTAADKMAPRPIRPMPIRLVFSTVNTRAAASTARVSTVSPHAAAWCVTGRRAGPASPMMTTVDGKRSGNVTAGSR